MSDKRQNHQLELAFLQIKLKLKVNSEKSAVARPWERKFLGFSFARDRQPKRRICAESGEAVRNECEN